MARNQAGFNNRNTTRDAKGRVTSTSHLGLTGGGLANQFTTFNEGGNTKQAKHVIEKHDQSVGGIKGENGKNIGHNYTSDGAKGSLTRRQVYYDTRVGMGLVGG